MPTSIPVPPKAQTIVRVAIKAFVVEITRDPDTHAECLLAGRFAFKPKFLEVLKAYLGASPPNVLGTLDKHQLVEQVFQHLINLWDRLHPQVTPRAYIEADRPSEPTAAEIENAWEVEIGSSDAYMRRYWHGSARTRTGSLDDLGAIRDPRHGS